MLFFAPSGDEIRWSEDGVTGARRFMGRLWEALAPRADTVRGFAGQPVQLPALTPAAREIRRRLHAAIARATEAFEGNYQFNTAIAALMEFLNAWTDADLGADPADGPVVAEAALAVTRLLAPMAPHLAEELWARFAQKGSVLEAPWPEVDPAALVVDEVELAVQVNGKVKGHVTVQAKATEEEIRKAVLAHPAVAGKSVKMVKVVPGRLVNIVVIEGGREGAKAP
jgi:leucyl-tRNA synthetase